MSGGRPRREQVPELDAESERILEAYFNSDKSTLEIAAEFGISRRAIYRRINRAQRNRRKAARAEAPRKMESA